MQRERERDYTYTQLFLLRLWPYFDLRNGVFRKKIYVLLRSIQKRSILRRLGKDQVCLPYTVTTGDGAVLSESTSYVFTLASLIFIFLLSS